MPSRWPDAIEDWITPSAAARALNVSPDSVHRFAEQGRLRFVKVAYGKLFDPASVEALKAKRVKVSA